jgi:CheY-like chemotaxis protein
VTSAGLTKVLICDDEPLLRELMRAALVGEYAIEEAGTVAEAIEAARDFRPDVALIDVMMPGGSGLDVIRHLNSEPDLRHARCLVVSAFSTEHDREEARKAGADAFIPKPFDPDDLSRAVAALAENDP